jgi:hypothetical protein
MWTVIGTIAIVLGTIVIGVFVERRFGPKRLEAGKRAKQLDAPGDSPATALSGDLAKLRQQLCCKQPMAVEDDRITYDGRELVVLRFTCAECGAKRSLYVTARARA